MNMRNHLLSNTLTWLSKLVLLMFVALLIQSHHQLKAAETISTSYLNPFPAGGTYKVLVIGDGYADGLSYGLKSAMSGNKKIEISRDVSYGANLITEGRKDWIKKLEKLLQLNNYDIAVLMIGYGDRRSIKLDGERYDLETAEWRNNYRKRISEVLRIFSRYKVALYWVGMPIVNGTNTSAAMKIINENVKTQTTSAQVNFIDNWQHFANEDGQYTQYGPDVNGKIRLLRPKDGVYFTRAGNEKLAHFVAKFIQRDLREAKEERNIPLFGDTPEQDYLLRRHVLDDPKNIRKRAIRQAKNKDNAQDNTLKQLTGIGLQRNKYDTARHSSITIPPEKAYNGKEVTIQVVRPAIPAAAFALSQRSKSTSSTDDDPNGAEILVENIDKFVGLAITSATQQLSTDDTQRNLPLTQTPYYKLLVRGDPLQSKADRADHFTWTKSDEDKLYKKSSAKDASDKSEEQKNKPVTENGNEAAETDEGQSEQKAEGPTNQERTELNQLSEKAQSDPSN